MYIFGNLNFSHYHRDIYAETVSSRPKRVVIVIDTSMALSDNQLNTGKEVAKQAVNSLSQRDQVCSEANSVNQGSFVLGVLLFYLCLSSPSRLRQLNS